MTINGCFVLQQWVCQPATDCAELESVSKIALRAMRSRICNVLEACLQFQACERVHAHTLTSMLNSLLSDLDAAGAQIVQGQWWKHQSECLGVADMQSLARSQGAVVARLNLSPVWQLVMIACSYQALAHPPLSSTLKSGASHRRAAMSAFHAHCRHGRHQQSPGKPHHL